jgi:hypothetical protein
MRKESAPRYSLKILSKKAMLKGISLGVLIEIEI